ncbi:hypothetical protein [Mycolicibacterium novocastrense]|uniref:Acetyl-CoA acetyltransferase n=1 Tax=Mycolicibacterium novocastrense TaxID=59813 RepID=A0ABQ0KJA6_MYCNV|nr:hypothetical protein [Mycolicibacterium novocastrense]GAT09665.1 acetyl-CoA acetyltransferase [Mycolicibacterium novocastrense]
MWVNRRLQHPVVLPLGPITGAGLAKTNALKQPGGRYALQTMCEGGGMANATIIERL